MDDRAYWELIACRYQEAFGEGLRGVAAFGSRARGEARPGSDHDLLLVAGGLAPDPFVRSAQVRGPLAGLGALQVQVLARTPEEFVADVTPLHLDLALDAIVLLERERFLTLRLERLRELLALAGLERGPDLFWRWRSPPKVRDWAITWEGVRA
jgi:predicted nucleotidyltransferase